MPLSQEETNKLDNEFGGFKSKASSFDSDDLTSTDLNLLDSAFESKPAPHIERASYKNPDHQAEVIQLAESRNLDLDTSERNLDELKRQERTESISTEGYPKLSDYMNDDRNSRVSIDDTGNLKGLEKALLQTDIKRSWGELGTDIALDLTKGVVGFGQSTVGIADLLTFNMVGHGLEAIGYDAESTKKILSSYYSKSRKQTEENVQNVKGFTETIGALVENPSVAFGAALESLPMMIGSIAAAKAVAAKLLATEGLVAGTTEASAFLSQPHIISKLTLAGSGAEGAMTAGNIQEDARAKGRDYIQSAPFAVLSGALTAAIGYGTGKLLPDVEASFAAGTPTGTTLIESGKKIAQGFVKEGVLEELPQSIQEQVFTNLAMDKPWLEGVPKSAAMGLVTGSLMGGSMQTINQLPSVFSRSIKDKADAVVTNISEQSIIDQATFFAQESKTRGRKEDRYRTFLQTLNSDKQVHISSDAVIEAAKNGVELPVYITEQLDSLGTDITVDMEQFGADIAPNEDIMNALRPHMRLSSESLSPAQLEAADDFSIKSLLEKAEKSKAALTEAETIYEDVKQQLVDTGRQSEATARYSAAIIPAYATVKAEQTGKNVKEIYEMMGLSIVGPATVNGDGKTLEQADAASIDSIKQSSKEQGVKLSVNEKGNNITLDKIIVSDEKRDSGVGTAIMNQLNQYADDNGKTIALTPSSDFGGNKKRLVEFYKRFGFVENKGKNKDFEISESMFREPKVKTLFQTDESSDAFINWAGTENIIDSDEINDTDFTGDGPFVVKAFHGTTHAFNEFEALRGNKEWQFGAVNYFTSSESDADINYAGEGPDLTNRIERRSERIEDELSYMDSEDILELAREHKLEFNPDDETYPENLSEEMARKELSGGKEKVMELYIRTDKPFVIGDNQWVEIREEITDEELYEQAADDTGEDIDTIKESPEDFEDAIDEARWAIESDRESPLAEAINEVASRYGIDAGELAQRVYEFDESATSDDVESLMREAEEFAYADDPETGGLIGYQMLGEVIQEMGYDSIILKNAEGRFSSMEMEHGTSHVHIFDANNTNIKSVENVGTFDPTDPNIYHQPAQTDGADKSKRGSIRIDDDSMIIKMHQASDLSTFLHESAHLFLEMEMKFAEITGVSEDQQVILDWLGVKSFSDITTEHHEKFSESFEVYLREGKAPSLALRDAFAAFKRWLTRIYESLSDPRLKRAELNDEVIDVFDRLLASEAEIELAMANPAYDQFFKSKEQAGMTDAEWDAYLKRQEQTKNRSQETLDTKVMKELTRRYTKEWKEEKEPLIEEEMERLSQETVYKVSVDIHKAPMDRAMVKEIMDYDKLPKELRGKTIIGGADPQAYSEINGYIDAETMINEIVSTPKLKDAANDAAEARMIEKYGDILNDGTIKAEAQEAIHNETQAQLLLEELRALKPERANKINRDYLKAEAKNLICSMTFKEIQPNKYYRAEIKAAQKAVTTKDKEQQYIHKVQQLANHYMYREAVETKERMTRQRKYVNQRAKKAYAKGVVTPKYAQNIMMLAKSYIMNDSTNIPYVLNWMESQLKDENKFIDFDIYDPSLIKMLDDDHNGLEVDYSLTKFDDMTADELRGLFDQLKHMRFVGGKLTNEYKAKLTFDRNEASESIDKHSTKKIKPTHDESKHQGKIDTTLGFFYSQRRIGGIFETLDGFEENGAMAKEYSLINQASSKKLELSDKMVTLMDEALKQVLDIVNRSRNSTIKKEDGNDFTLNHRARFTLALNWGNDGNKKAVIEGMGKKFGQVFTENDIVKMLSTMSNKELNAVNKIWKSLETLWPELSGVETRLKGVSPSKVQAVPFIVNGVEMSGGHYRLHYRKDPDDTSRSSFEDHYVADGKIKLGTASSANERVGSGGRQVSLDLGHLFTDLEENIHYITHAELASHLNAMFKGVNNPVVSSIINGYGQPYYDNLIDTLSVQTQKEDPVKGVWKALQYVRMNLVYGFLIGSVRNIVQQPIAITNAFSQLGFLPVAKGLLTFYSNPTEHYEYIRSISPFMKSRTKLVNREAREQLMKIDSLHPKIGAMKNMAFLPQTFADGLIAYPVWMAAYDKSGGNIEYANEMVAKTIGSGLSKDLGSLFSQGEGMKQLTFMGTFFNLTWNLHVENAQLLKRGKISGMEYARRLGWMAVAPALISMWILKDIPEDDDEAIVHALKEIGYYNLSSVMVLRDLGTGMKGFEPTIPGLAFVKGVVVVGKEAKDLVTGDTDLDMETTANILRGLQPLAPLPASGQIIRTMKGTQDPKQTTWGKIVEGKDRN